MLICFYRIYSILLWIYKYFWGTKVDIINAKNKFF
jgi:hypothetical protein